MIMHWTKAKRQLAAEVRELRTKVADLEKSDMRRAREEEALRRSEEQYRIIADNTYDWESLLAPDDSVIYTSPSCERITGHSACVFREHPDLLRQLIHPEDRRIMQAHRREELDLQASDDIEFRIMLPDGSIKWIAHTCQPAYALDGRFIGTRGSNRDITLQKAMQEEKERLILQLTDALAKIKTLRGMLPICAKCKKIRDDKGYWEHIESYIRDHSDAEFTHGICPDCAKDLYPDYSAK